MTARILIVADEPAKARLLEASLSAEYDQVASVADGFAAVERAKAWQPDLILLDLSGMAGDASCGTLKQTPEIRHIPVVMVTALDEPSAKLRGLEAGADDFLTRPIELPLLMLRVRSLLRLKHLTDAWRALGVSARGAQAPSIAGIHALVIDDWDAGAQNVQDMLARAGVIAGRAGGEAAALTLCAGIRFDLIILNLCMEPEDPLKLLASLRAADATRAVPILLLAEPGERARLLRGFELGADDWLMLPLDETELRARVRNQIRRKFYQDRLLAAP